jgi:hypothetical protein
MVTFLHLDPLFCLICSELIMLCLGRGLYIIDGCLCRFLLFSWWPILWRCITNDQPILSRCITSNQRMFIVLKNLPPYMWTLQLQSSFYLLIMLYNILIRRQGVWMTPQCIYTCVVCSQKLIRIPNAIAIKVSDVKATEASDLLGTVGSLF